MNIVCIAGKDYVLADNGSVMVCVPHLRIPRIDPQLALKRARLVYDRTLVDKHPGFGGPAMAKFTTEQHILTHYTGKYRHYRLSPEALLRLLSIVATW